MIGNFSPNARNAIRPQAATQLPQQAAPTQVPSRPQMLGQPVMGNQQVNPQQNMGMAQGVPGRFNAGFSSAPAQAQPTTPNMFANAIMKRDQMMKARYPQPKQYVKDTAPYVPTQTTYNNTGAAPVNVANSAYPAGFVPAKNPITGL